MASRYCISGWILFSATLFLLSSASQSASQTSQGANTGPLWKLDIAKMGYKAPEDTALDNQELGAVLGIEPICFLGDGIVVVSFVTREAPVAPPNRGQTDESLPYRLHGIFIDTKTGAVHNTMEWPTASVRSRILAVPGEKFAVLTPDQLLLYSSAFGLISKLEIPLGREAIKDRWDATTSPAGNFLLLSYEPATEEKRFSGLPYSVYVAQLDTLEMRLMWVDLDKLQVVERWSTTEKSAGGFMWPEDISDDGTVQIQSSTLSNNRNSLPLVKIGRPPNGPWSLMCSRWASSCGAGRFVNDETILRMSVTGQDKNVRLWIGLLSITGKLLFEQTFPEGEIEREGFSITSAQRAVAISSNGSRFALGLVKVKRGNRSLDIGGRSWLNRIIVYDLLARRWIYSLDAKTQHFSSISGMALSRTGSMLGLIDQRGILQVYLLPDSSN